MSALEEIQAKVPSAMEEIARLIHIRPTSVGVTKKNGRLAFLINLPVTPPAPGPNSLFGIPVVYGQPASPSVFLARRRRRP